MGLDVVTEPALDVKTGGGVVDGKGQIGGNVPAFT